MAKQAVEVLNKIMIY